MTKIFKKILLLSIFFPALLLAQSYESQDYAVPNEPSPERSMIVEKSKFITFTIENDSLASGTDKGYTSGVLLTYFNSGYRPRALAGWMNRHLPLIDFNDHTKISFSIGQNIYTPEHVEIKEQQNNDRPWAGFLYGAVRTLTVSQDHADDLEFTLGIVGPSAQAENTQKTVHKIVNSHWPQGWDNQLKDEPGIMLSWRRRWIEIFSGNISSLSYSVEPNIGFSVGNVYTLAETGLLFRVMSKSRQWVDTPLLIRPSMPGSSFFHTAQDKFNWYVFAGVQGRAIARNIFLDGNTFKDSPSIDKRNFVADLNAGLALVHGDWRVSYTYIFRTKEFDGQHSPSQYGNINLGYSF